MWFTGSAFRPLSLVSLSYPWLLERMWKRTYSTTMLLSYDCICWCVWHLNVEDFIYFLFFSFPGPGFGVFNAGLAFIFNLCFTFCLTFCFGVNLWTDPLADGIFCRFSLGEKRSWSLDCSPFWVFFSQRCAVFRGDSCIRCYGRLWKGLALSWWGVCAGLRGKESELLAHRYAGRTPLPQVLAASQICLTHTRTPPHTHGRRCIPHP